MIRRERAFYRSNFVRWACAATGLMLAVAFCPWSSDRWHATPSLIWLHQFLPWPLMSALFLIYAVLLTQGSVQASVAADYLGLFLYLCEFIALIVTAGGHPSNPLVFVAFFLTCVLHLAAGRLALTEQEEAR